MVMVMVNVNILFCFFDSTDINICLVMSCEMMFLGCIIYKYNPILLYIVCRSFFFLLYYSTEFYRLRKYKL